MGLANLLATIGRLPRAAESAEVIVSTKQNAWRRLFNGRPMTSQWVVRNTIACEEFGPFRFAFHLKPLGDNRVGFAHVTQRMWFFGIPIPRWCMLYADGDSEVPSNATKKGWNVRVHVKHPWFGTIVTYEGFLAVSSATPSLE